MLSKKNKGLLTLGVVGLGVLGLVNTTTAGTFFPYAGNSYEHYHNPWDMNSSHAQIPLTNGIEPTPPYDRVHQNVSGNSTNNNMAGSGNTINVDKTQGIYTKPNQQQQSNGHYTVNGNQGTLENSNLTSGWASDNYGSFIRVEGNKRLTGWQRVSGYWYYFGTDGYMRKGWQQVGSSWYYLSNEGHMQTGWKNIGGSWYLLGSNGAMKTGWQYANGKWYFLTSSGTMKTGWLNIRGKWYFMTESGAMKTGWLKQGNNWYFLKGDGSMMVGRFRIGSTIYTASASGVCSW